MFSFSPCFFVAVDVFISAFSFIPSLHYFLSPLFFIYLFISFQNLWKDKGNLKNVYEKSPISLLRREVASGLVIFGAGQLQV